MRTLDDIWTLQETNLKVRKNKWHWNLPEDKQKRRWPLNLPRDQLKGRIWLWPSNLPISSKVFVCRSRILFTSSSWSMSSRSFSTFIACNHGKWEFHVYANNVYLRINVSESIYTVEYILRTLQCFLNYLWWTGGKLLISSGNEKGPIHDKVRLARITLWEQRANQTTCAVELNVWPAWLAMGTLSTPFFTIFWLYFSYSIDPRTYNQHHQYIVLLIYLEGALYKYLITLHTLH